jgi:methylase of polypeptide subunit release factors
VSTGQRTVPSESVSQSPRGDAMPIRIGSAEEFARCRDFLRAAGFDERAVTSTLKISDISQIPYVDTAAIDSDSVSPVLLALIDFFVLGNVVTADGLLTRCGEAAFTAFAGLDLIRDARRFAALAALDLLGGSVICPISLYPVDGLLIASDRRIYVGGDAVPIPADVVFSAHDSGTLKMLRLLPTAAGDALDLCGGSGVGALHLARNGSRAATADITARSAHFAAFNARLNGIEIEILRGDLYAPVASREFDLICAHPPWVPSTGDAMAFRDGGDTGEAIVERVFAGLGKHLRQGGTGVVVSLGRDGRDARYEQRVRRWLGHTGRDCDVILGVDHTLSIADTIESIRRLHLNNDAEKAERMAARFRELGTEQFVYGAVLVRRTAAAVAEPPLRLRMSSAATANDFDRVFAWRQHRRRPEFVDWLTAARPRLCPQLESNVRSVVRNGVMVAESAILTAKRPLAAAVRPDVWIARLLERLEGTQTVEQTFDAARHAGQMPADFTLAAFADLVDQMIERGLLDVDTPAAGRS